ncbi:MAG: DUF2608 domain-containing protein, partial [Chlamydiales bacterium]|nr:DUF2608 domain-containing protein [Chlamydiales bacterium]
MAHSIAGFKSIDSLDALTNHLVFPLKEKEWGILALDLDQTLIQGRPTLGDEHFYRFMQNQNRLHDLPPDAHYAWTVQVREKIPYEACEPFERINQILEKFKQAGWTVIILTSRGLEMRDCTQQHLADSKIHLKIADVVFKEKDLNGKRMTKDQSLIQWMKKQPPWNDAVSIRVQFADDLEKYCAEVAQISEAVASVECLHYTGALPNPELSDAQMQELTIQLNAYRQNLPVPYENDLSDAAQAALELGMTEINPSQLYQAIQKVAAEQGYTFEGIAKLICPLNSP